MEEIETLLGLLVAMTLLVALARKINVPYPIFLVIGGLAIGFVPGLPGFELKPETVFLLFLPPISRRYAISRLTCGRLVY